MWELVTLWVRFTFYSTSTTQVVCITEMINHKLISFSTVLIYDLSCILLQYYHCSTSDATKLCQSCSVSCLPQFDNIKWGSPRSNSFLKLKLMVFLAGHIVTMVTYCAIDRKIRRSGGGVGRFFLIGPPFLNLEDIRQEKKQNFFIRRVEHFPRGKKAKERNHRSERADRGRRPWWNLSGPEHGRGTARNTQGN